jgi:glycosyltransferase involved in cell wall biosynthesis
MSEWLLNDTKRRTAPISRGLPGRSNWDFINNPVELPYTDQCLSIADRWHDDGAIILGRCGRPDPGIYHAINVRAANILRMEGYDVRFIVVAPPENMIDDLVGFDIPFYIVEPTADPLVLSTFYNSVDIYAHARADGETFGVNIAEAMIHGKPVVTHVAEPSVPGMGVFQSQTTLVDHNQTGFISTNDVGSYTDNLRALIQNNMRAVAMGQCGKEKAEREYLACICARKLENVYREIIND